MHFHHHHFEHDHFIVFSGPGIFFGQHDSDLLRKRGVCNISPREKRSVLSFNLGKEEMK